jgi:hypothetical protein
MFAVQLGPKLDDIAVVQRGAAIGFDKHGWNFGPVPISRKKSSRASVSTGIATGEISLTNGGPEGWPSEGEILEPIEGLFLVQPEQHPPSKL